MELQSQLEIPGKVEVVGFVNDLSEYYAKAQFVIAPIFDGSGMKTKVAEALMHGKRVVGTPDAFVGYEFAVGACWVCHTADDFVEAIGRAQNEIKDLFDQSLRSIYLQHYSLPAAEERLRGVLL